MLGNLYLDAVINDYIEGGLLHSNKPQENVNSADFTMTKGSCKA